MRIVAYSDIHFCDSWKLVSLEDIVAVHRRLNEYVRDTQPDVVLFLGDRFRARQPKDHVRAAADQCMLELASCARDVIVVKGNHDNYSESVGSGDTYSAIRMFREAAMPNVIVADHPRTVRKTGVSFHCLPSGFAYRPEDFGPKEPGQQVFLYHGMVAGAIQFVDKGIPLETLDQPQYDLVLCGDVHTPTVFPMKHAVGGYIGSTLRLTEADAGDMRGWVDVILESGKKPVCTLIEGGGPQFHKLALTADRSTWPVPEQYSGGVILATLKGRSADLRPFTDDVVKAAFPGSRVEVHRDYEHDVASLVEGISVDTMPLDDVRAYIGSTDRGGLDGGRLAEKARVVAESMPERKGLFA